MIMKTPAGACIVAGTAIKDAEVRENKNGKEYTRLCVRYGTKPDPDGSPKRVGLLLNVVADGYVGKDAAIVKKFDGVQVCGTLESHEYNGRQYTTLRADFVGPSMGWCGRMGAFSETRESTPFDSDPAPDGGPIVEQPEDLPF